MKIDVLFFAAHPDDAELSCGGTISKLIKLKKKVGIIDLTQGELGTRGSKSLRYKEAESARKVLDVTFRKNLKIKDGNIVNSPTNRIKIIRLIRHYKPEIIFIPYYKDRHPDHTHANELVKNASFYSGLSKIKTSYMNKSQTSHRPKKNIYYMQTYAFEPSFIIDISNEFANKMKAVMCYSSQFYSPDLKGPQTFISDKKFLDSIEARAKFYGFKIGVKYGEPFYMEEEIKLDAKDIFNL